MTGPPCVPRGRRTGPRRRYDQGYQSGPTDSVRVTCTVVLCRAPSSPVSHPGRTYAAPTPGGPLRTHPEGNGGEVRKGSCLLPVPSQGTRTPTPRPYRNPEHRPSSLMGRPRSLPSRLLATPTPLSTLCLSGPRTHLSRPRFRLSRFPGDPRDVSFALRPSRSPPFRSPPQTARDLWRVLSGAQRLVSGVSPKNTKGPHPTRRERTPGFLRPSRDGCGVGTGDTSGPTPRPVGDPRSSVSVTGPVRSVWGGKRG